MYGMILMSTRVIGPEFSVSGHYFRGFFFCEWSETSGFNLQKNAVVFCIRWNFSHIKSMDLNVKWIHIIV